MLPSSTPEPQLSLVIACFNEEQIIESSLSRLFEVLDNLRIEIEVIFVDDASLDGTRAAISRFIEANPHRRLRRIDHPYNVGRGGTVSDGFRASRGVYVGFIDIDLEVHPSYILPCLIALQRGYDVATAYRVFKIRPQSILRYLVSRSYAFLLRWHTKVPLKDTETGFKFFRRDCALALLDQVQDKGWFWDTEIMVRAHRTGLRIAELPALFVRRSDKKSSVRIVRDSILHFRKLRELSRSLPALQRASE